MPDNRLFDQVESGTVSGNLHLLPDAAVDRYITRYGARAVVRQLAADLAEREAELLLLRKQKEDRERELKRIVVQAGISLSDVEKRLNAVSIRDPGKAIDVQVGEALEQPVVDSDTFPPAHLHVSTEPTSTESMSDDDSSKDVLSDTSQLSRDLDQVSLKSGATSHDTPPLSSSQGPLELGEIVPDKLRPPTLSRSHSSTEHITDKYGFVYGRHSTRDSLKTTRKSSLTPVTTDGSDSSAKIKRQECQTTAVTVNIASNPPSPYSARSLLQQIGDQHDDLQRVQTHRWDEFLRKVEETVDPLSSAPVLGILGSNLTDKSMAKEFKNLIYTGIPVQYRPKLWGESSGAWQRKEPGTYQWLCEQEDDENDEAIKQIDLDLYRTMPSNIYFGGTGLGVAKLRRILVAFSKWNREIGYCQGMNMIAGMLLLSFPTEEDAFWVLVSLIENILPEGYFCSPLTIVKTNLETFREIFPLRLPKLHQHLTSLQVDIDAIVFDWFLSCFTDALQAESLFRIWDVLLCCQGYNYLFKVGLGLFKIHEQKLLSMESAGSFYSFMKNLNSRTLKVDTLLSIADKMSLEMN